MLPGFLLHVYRDGFVVDANVVKLVRFLNETFRALRQ
jgi:hypothetical protein